MSRQLRSVVGFCEFVRVAGLEDLRHLQVATDRCALEAAAVLARRGGQVERLLYDRVAVVFPPIDAREAVAAALDLRRAITAVDRNGDRLDVAIGLADGDLVPRGWGRAHILARALANAARTGEVLVDERLRRRLGPGLACARVAATGIPAWRLLSGS